MRSLSDQVTSIFWRQILQTVRTYSSRFVFYRDIPDGSLEAASYWKWFVAKYTVEVAEYFHMEPTEIPASWRSLTQEKVKEDLKKLYHL